MCIKRRVKGNGFDKGRIGWLAGEEGFQRREEWVALLPQRGEVAAEPGEGGATTIGAKATGDLLLHLQHAQVPLGLIVVEGDR